MLDARSNTPGLGAIGPKKVKRAKLTLRPFFILSLAFVFLVNSLGGGLFTGESWAARTSSGLTSVGPESTGSPTPLKNLSADTFMLPQELGYLQEAVSSPGSTRTVVHIQDAHCNYAAQKRISEILNYLTTEYGIYSVNCEGGAGSYDLSVFTEIPEKEIREKTSDFFVKEGVVNAAEFFAVNNPEKVKLWGVEDADLYIKDLRIYRDSLAHKAEVDRYLKSIGYILDNLKKHIYSKALLEFDNYYAGYKENKIGFKEYTTYLITTAGKRLIKIKSFSNIYLLSQTLEQEEKINFRRANNEKDEVVDKMKKVLSRNELRELLTKVGEIKSEKISQGDFYAYLVKKAKSVKLDLGAYPELEKYIVYISIYSAIDRTKITKEMDTLENRIAGSMYENDTQRELGILSKNLILEKNMFNISLTRDDYMYYTEHRASFAVSNFVRFIEAKAPLYKIRAALDPDIYRLDIYRDKMNGFYECSLERDKAFIKNIKFTDHDRPSSIIITGGFHTENLRELFGKENVSYISIMPKFVNAKGYESPYLKRLAGQRTALENVIDTAIPAILNLAVVNILSGLAIEVEGRPNVERFRFAVLVVAAIMRGPDFIVKIGRGVAVKGMPTDEDKIIIFSSGEGGNISFNQVSGTEAARYSGKVNAEITDISSANFAYKLAKLQAQAPTVAAPGANMLKAPVITPLNPPDGTLPSLIGKLVDRDGNIITAGFGYFPKEANKITIRHPGMEDVTVETTGEVPDQEVGSLITTITRFVENPRNGLSDNERTNLSVLINRLKSATSIVKIKPNEKVLGFFLPGTAYLNETLVTNPIGLMYEMGAGYINLPEGYPALTRHTFMRGVGSDVRRAFNAVEGMITERTTPVKLEELIEAIEKKMKETEFIISETRDKDHPMTESEKALINYNASQMVDGKNRTARELLYGLQDRLDPELNAAFTQGIRIITNDLRQNMMNIFVLRASDEARAPQTAVGREIAGTFDKKYGISTGVFYFKDNKELKKKIMLALEEAARPENEGKYPKILVDCLSQEELDAVKGIIDEIKEEIKGETRFEGVKDKLDNMIAIARDFEKGEIREGLSIPDEVRVIAIGSALMNDKRLKVDFGMSAVDLFESRKKTLEFLAATQVIADQIKGRPISEITVSDAQLFDGFMDDIWKGIQALHCTRIDWKKLDDWKDAQRQLLQSV